MNAQDTMQGRWVVRIVDGESDRGIGEVVVGESRIDVRLDEAVLVVQGSDIASVAREWSPLRERIRVTRRDGSELVLDHGVLPGSDLFAAVVHAAGGPNAVRPDRTP